MGAAALVGVGLLAAGAEPSSGYLRSGGVTLVSLGTYLALLSATVPPRGATSPGIDRRACGRARAAAGRGRAARLTAGWCIACKELDRYTFSDPAVVAAAARYLAVKVDLTDDDDPAAAATKAEHRIVGLPTVLLFDRQGREAVRCTDFVPADEFRAFVERVE
jgi:thiol:disulfide interchange protein DsbD